MAQEGERASAVDAELKDVKQAIKEVEDDITAVTKSLESLNEEIRRVKEAKDHVELKFLREREMKLMDKEKQLRDKEKQLRDEKLRLMDRLKPEGGPQGPTVADSGIQQLKASLLEKDIIPIGEGSSMGVIELPRLVNSVKEHTVFVRAIYHALYDMVEETALRFAKGEDVPNGVVITGNPGIGKSVGLLNYILWHCSRKGRTVVFECLGQKATYVFDFSNIRIPVQRIVGRPAAVAALDQRETWYLVDPGGHKSAEEPLSCPAFTVIATSPNPSHYQQFLKDVGWKIWLPVWTLEELRLFAPHYWPNMNAGEREQLVERRFDELGGIPRFVLCNETKFKEGLMRRDSALTPGATSLFRFTGPDFESQFAEQRHMIFHAEVEATKGDHAFQISQVVPGSPEIDRRLRELLPTIAVGQLRRFVAVPSDVHAGPQGHVFEYLAFMDIAQAGNEHSYGRRLVHEWDTMQAKRGTAVSGQEEQVRLNITSNLVSILKDWRQHLQPGIVYKANRQNQESWDGLLLQGWEGRDIILQAKSGKAKKAIKLKGLQELLRMIPSLGKAGGSSRRQVDLVVVVPPDRYDEPKGAFPYEGSWGTGMGGPEDFPIIRQYLLCVDVRSYPSILTPPGSTE